MFASHTMLSEENRILCLQFSSRFHTAQVGSQWMGNISSLNTDTFPNFYSGILLTINYMEGKRYKNI